MIPVKNGAAGAGSRLYWIALKNVRGIGNRTIKLLAERFGHPRAVAGAGRNDLLAVEGVTPRMADAIRAAFAGGDFSRSVKKEFDLSRRKGYRLITQTEEAYPRLLLEIHDPPPYLYVNGQKPVFSPAVAVVGSRHPTAYGTSMAKRLGADLASAGLVVVSGMAAGIDAAAHRGALSAGGTTIAVLGSGLAVIYPPENRSLYHDIAEAGAVVSELPVLEPPRAYHFPARNRIISGMTMGTVVVEAAAKSGSLITARLAAEQGRDVFAVPGSIRSCKSIGTHGLLKQGAMLVEKVDDILEEFSWAGAVGRGRGARSSGPGNAARMTGGQARDASPELTQAQTDVYYLLEPYPVHVDVLAEKGGMEAGRLLMVLSQLELMGLAVQTPGKFFMSSGDG